MTLRVVHSSWHLSDLKISYRRILPRYPEVNVNVKRSYKTDSEKFYWDDHPRINGNSAERANNWETQYNEDRPHR